MRRALSPLLTVLAVLLAGAPALAAELRLTVTGLRSDDGDVHVAIYDDPAHFPDSDGMLLETQTRIEGGEAHIAFSGLAPASYAIAVYHDEDGDDDFDQFVFGLPLEGYGFSNDAPVFFGPPTFAEAAFTLGDEDLDLAIRIRY